MNPFDNHGGVQVRPDQGDADSRSTLSERVQSLRLPSHPVPAGGRAWIPWILCALLAAYASWLTLSNRESAQPDVETGGTPSASTASSRDAESAPLTTAAPTGEIALESKGYIIPAHQILVSPKVSGMVMKLNIEEGQRITKGDILAELESIDYAADHARAQATLNLALQHEAELTNGNRPEEVKQAEAELEESRYNLVQAELEWNRNRDLRKKNVIAESDFELSESKFRGLQRRVNRLQFAVDLMREGARQERRDAARAEVDQARADLAKARWRLDNCTIRAPISGTILKKNAEEGNIVNPIAFNGSFSLCDMADLSDLEVDLSIQERDVSRVFKGQRCRVRAEAFPERVYQGVVSRLMPIADRAKGAIPVRVKLTVPAKEEGVYLKPEMGAIVSFLNPSARASGDASARVPAEAPSAPAGSRNE